MPQIIAYEAMDHSLHRTETEMLMHDQKLRMIELKRQIFKEYTDYRQNLGIGQDRPLSGEEITAFIIDRWLLLKAVMDGEQNAW